MTDAPGATPVTVGAVADSHFPLAAPAGGGAEHGPVVSGQTRIGSPAASDPPPAIVAPTAPVVPLVFVTVKDPVCTNVEWSFVVVASSPFAATETLTAFVFAVDDPCVVAVQSAHAELPPATRATAEAPATKPRSARLLCLPLTLHPADRERKRHLLAGEIGGRP